MSLMGTHTNYTQLYTRHTRTKSPMGAPYGGPLWGLSLTGAPYGGVSTTGAFTFMGMSPHREKNDFHSLKADHHLLHRDAHVVIYIKLIDYCFANMYGWQVHVNMDTQIFWLDFAKKSWTSVECLNAVFRFKAKVSYQIDLWSFLRVVGQLKLVTNWEKWAKLWLFPRFSLMWRAMAILYSLLNLVIQKYCMILVDLKDQWR